MTKFQQVLFGIGFLRGLGFIWGLGFGVEGLGVSGV